MRVERSRVSGADIADIQNFLAGYAWSAGTQVHLPKRQPVAWRDRARTERKAVSCGHEEERTALRHGEATRASSHAADHNLSSAAVWNAIRVPAQPNEVVWGVFIAAWLVDRESGSRILALWPRGTTAVFDPSLTVVLRDGTIFHREGDVITGACRIGEDGVGLIPG